MSWAAPSVVESCSARFGAQAGAGAVLAEVVDGAAAGPVVVGGALVASEFGGADLVDGTIDEDADEVVELEADDAEVSEAAGPDKESAGCGAEADEETRVAPFPQPRPVQAATATTRKARGPVLRVIGSGR